MDLNEVAVFVKVVEMGSFAGAAKQLEMPKSTVSAKVSGLERRLGVTLIRRTTRKLSVTDAGKDFYQSCLKGLEQIAGAEEQIRERQAVPQGMLRITAPIELGVTLLPGLLLEYQKKFPQVRIEIALNDREVDLVSEGFDLAIRAGELRDSTMIAKKLGTVHFAPFASPKYLKTRSAPAAPKDLAEHQIILFTPLGKQGWPLKGPKGSQFVDLPTAILINDLNLTKSMVLNGGGIGLLPNFYCHGEVESGKLVRVLKDWKSHDRPVHFVYPNQEFVPMKLKSFLEIGTEMIRKSLESYIF